MNWKFSGTSIFRPAVVLSGLVFLGISLPSFALALESCSLLEADPDEWSGALQSGRVIGDKPVEVLSFIPSECDASCAGQMHPRIDPKTVVAVGQPADGFVCIHSFDKSEMRKVSGWVPSDLLETSKLSETPTPLSAWIGRWKALEESASILIRAEHDALGMTAYAAYPNPDEPRAEGKIDAAIHPVGSAVRFNDDASECKVAMFLMGEWLAVVDNSQCAGLEVRFADIYRRVSP